MAKELIYTSAQRGLRPGTRGFCTVAYTEGMRPDQIQLLESLSAYRDAAGVHQAETAASPTAFSHYRYSMAGHPISIVSRVAPAAADHTFRSNKIAHHVMLSTHERPQGGPAWLCAQSGFFQEAWQAEPHLITEPKTLPSAKPNTCKAHYWEQVTGDAGWAGAVAESFLRTPNRTVALIYTADTDTLSLFLEASLLLPEANRWQLTFNTYFSVLPTGMTCCWRGCLSGSEAERDARRNSKALIIDLTQALGQAPNTPLSEAARSGIDAGAEPASKGSIELQTFVKLPNRDRRSLCMKPHRRKESTSDDA